MDRRAHNNNDENTRTRNNNNYSDNDNGTVFSFMQMRCNDETCIVNVERKNNATYLSVLFFTSGVPSRATRGAVHATAYTRIPSVLGM